MIMIVIVFQSAPGAEAGGKVGEVPDYPGSQKVSIRPRR